MIPRPESLLAACGLPQAWQGRDRYTVLDLDFDDGTAFAATVRAWHWDPARPRRLRYAALMPACMPRDVWAAQAHRAGLDATLLAALHQDWPWPIEGVHRLELDDGAIQLTLAVGNALDLLPGLVPCADALYLRGVQVRHSLPLLRQACAALALGATAAAPLADALWIESLRSAGLQLADIAPDTGVLRVWRRAGIGVSVSAPPPEARRAVVLGSGLAGCAMAFALTRRGWSVVRLDTGPRPGVLHEPTQAGGRTGLEGIADEGSGSTRIAVLEPASQADPAVGSWQPVLAQHPSLTPDDGPLSRLTRAALALSQGPYAAGAMRWVGRLQMMEPAAARKAAGALPPDWVKVLDAGAASEKVGMPLTLGGLWLPQAGCADPQALCDDWTLPGTEVRRGAAVAQVRQSAGGWTCLDAAGNALAEAPVLVLAGGARGLEIEVVVAGEQGHANAHTSGHVEDRADELADGQGVARRVWAAVADGLDSEGMAAGTGEPDSLALPDQGQLHDAVWRLGDLFGDAGWQHRQARATLATLHDAALPGCILGGEGHCIPLGDGRSLLGPGDGRWLGLLDALGLATNALELTPAAVGTRLSCRDHLPLAGPVPDPRGIASQRQNLRRNDRLPMPVLPGLWTSTALGGRGLLWSVLCAELIAAQLEFEPLPLPRSLARALDPGRFLRRAWRRQLI